MKTSSIVAVVVAVMVIAGAVWWLMSQPAATPQANTQAPAAVADNTTPSAPMSATVTYGPNGFSPSTVTVAKGGTVTWVTAPGADEMWVASNPHPIHNAYDGTTLSQHCAAGYSGPAPLDQCSAGTSFSFTFNQVGTWGYHNHGNHSDTGTVVVQ
jgi:plastocyanin